MVDDYKVTVSMRMEIRLVEKIKDFKKRYRKSTFSGAVSDLIHTALTVESKLAETETIDSDTVRSIREQLENGQLVDYVERMDFNKFRHVLDIFKDEEKVRMKGQRRLF